MKHFVEQNKDKFGTDTYKFDKIWETTLKTKHDRNKKEYEVLCREVNDSTQANLSRIKDEIKECLDHQKKLTKDLTDLKMVIEKNEPEKKKELDQAFEKVSKDMGKIFKMLLKDCDARLVKKDKNNINAGIKVEVCFSGHWDNSLTQLSGGQKSFLVVSLIFAMLKYNPAPIYILDEIDAPLDENNT